MKSILPSSDELRYFVEIAVAENLTRAAERLGVTQPSLSLALNRLEHSVGTKLLHRGKSGVKLTSAGKKVLSETQDLLARWAKIKHDAIDAKDKPEGHLRLGIHPSVAIYSLPLFMPTIYEKYPKLNIRLVHDLSRRITENVIQWDLELGLVINPVKHPDLVSKKVIEDQVGFFSTPKADQTVVIYDPDLLQSQNLIGKARKQGFTFTREVQCSNLEVIKELALAGLGVGLLPGRVIGDGRNKLFPIKNMPVFKDELFLIYRVENKELMSLRVVVDETLDAFKSSARKAY